MVRYSISPEYRDMFTPSGNPSVRRLRTLMLRRIESVHGVQVAQEMDRRLEVRQAYQAADTLIAQLRSTQFGVKLDSPPSTEVVTEQTTRHQHVPASWWDHLKQTFRDRFGAWMDRNLPPGRPPVALRKTVRAIKTQTRPLPSAVTVRRETVIASRAHVCPHVGAEASDCIRFLNVPVGEDGADQRLLAQVKSVAAEAVKAFRDDHSIVGYFPDTRRDRFVKLINELDYMLSRQ